jgi:pimeloyl-ACP methyl ester carboxylesterase
LISVNGVAVTPGTIGLTVRNIAVGTNVRFVVGRDGKTVELSAPMLEKPRDPGNANYEVRYDHIVSNGQKMRTILTIPKKPGRHPGFFFIQGFSPVSYDYTLATSKGDVTTLDGPLLYEFANSGFVTMRVEKPGVGDSEGGPFAELDYITELDIYRQALKVLKSHSSVDKDNVFIFGHSMGGAFGPMIANEIPVKGIAVYGAAARTWDEYLLDILRYQGLLAGDSFENVDDTVRNVGRLFSLALRERQPLADITKSHPELKPYADGYLPGGMFNGKALIFWSQLGDINFAKYWAKCKAYVLSAHGASDYVTYDVDHKLIADVVNKVSPGKGTFVRIPNSDHLFHNFPTELASMQGMQKGKYSPGFAKTLKKWIAGIMKK